MKLNAKTVYAQSSDIKSQTKSQDFLQHFRKALGLFYDMFIGF
jgi:hypothetical protein